MSSYNLNNGFLILYDWMPALEMLSGDEMKKLLLALIDMQRDGTPLPDFGEKMTGVFAQMMEPTIKRRINGQKSSKGKNEKHSPYTSPGTPPGTSSPSRAERSEAEQSKAESLSSGEGVEEEDFEKFWREYPKHVGKAEARTAFAETVKSREDAEELMSLLKRWKKSSEWKRDKGKWIRRADKFLTEMFPTRDEPPMEEGSFDTDEFVEAALRKSYEYMAGKT